MKLQLRRREGFTLIELLIVIVIIGILAVGFAPTLLNAPRKARDAVLKGQMASIQQVFSAFQIENSTIPTQYSDFLAFFPGSVLPAYTTNIKYLLATSKKCYFLSAKVEDAGSGNAAAAPAVGDACTTPALVPSSAYYYVAVPIN